MLEVRVVEHDSGDKDFIRCSDGQILLQTSPDGSGRMYIGFVDKTLLPKWPAVPSWYPVEIAIEAEIHKHYQEEEK